MKSSATKVLILAITLFSLAFVIQARVPGDSSRFSPSIEVENSRIPASRSSQNVDLSREQLEQIVSLARQANQQLGSEEISAAQDSLQQLGEILDRVEEYNRPANRFNRRDARF